MKLASTRVSNGISVLARALSSGSFLMPPELVKEINRKASGIKQSVKDGASSNPVGQWHLTPCENNSF